MVKIRGMKPGSYAVVDRWTLARVHDSIQPEMDPREARDQQRKTLREKSKARVAHWGNTMEGKRLHKEKMMLQKIQEEEERRKEIDAREAEFREAERQKQLKRANKQLFLEDDRVKEFHSQLLVCEVMKERDLQATVKAEISRMNAETEAAHARKAERVNRKALRLKRRQKRAAKQQADAFKQMREEQLKASAARKEEARKAAEEESRQIRLAAEAEVQRVLEEERQRKVKQKELAHTYHLANMEQRKVKAARLAKEEEEVRKQEEYAKKKQAQLDERQRREKERFRAKLAQRQKLIDDQTAILEQMRSDRKEAYMRDVLDAENKFKARENEKKRRAEDLKAQIDRSRAIALEMREAKRKREAEHDRLVTAAMKRQAAALAEEEREEKRQQRLRSEKIQQYQLKQISQRKAQQEAELKAERKLRRMMKKGAKQTDDYFLSYVKEVTDEMIADGFDTKPLNKYLNMLKENGM